MGDAGDKRGSGPVGALHGGRPRNEGQEAREHGVLRVFAAGEPQVCIGPCVWDYGMRRMGEGRRVPKQSAAYVTSGAGLGAGQAWAGMGWHGLALDAGNHASTMRRLVSRIQPAFASATGPGQPSCHVHVTEYRPRGREGEGEGEEEDEGRHQQQLTFYSGHQVSSCLSQEKEQKSS